VGLAGARQSRGLGLSSMRQRAREAGGRCEVLSQPPRGSGTLIRAVLPRQAA